MNVETKKKIIHLMPRTSSLILHYKKKKRIRDSKKNHKASFEKKNYGRLIIVFILRYPQVWNSLKTVYEAAVKEEDIDAFVVVINDYSILSDGTKLSSVDYYRNQGIDVIEAVENGNIFDIKSLNPDIVFRQTPYDAAYPSDYSIANLAKYTKPCYVPYNYNFSPKKHLEIEYNGYMLPDMYAIFSESISNKNYCEKLKNEWYHELNVYYLGFPRFDLLPKTDFDRIRNRKCITFTWIPRWSVDSVNNDGTSFFDYKDYLIHYFKQNREVSLIIRPHPLMFKNFIKLGVMSEEEILSFIEMLKREPNISIDDNMDYIYTFNKTDALIADMSSLNYEFYLSGKPILYCGDVKECNDETQEMVRQSYIINNWDDMKKKIDELRRGIDVNFDLRIDSIKRVMSEMPDNVGKAIIEQCKKIMR